MRTYDKAPALHRSSYSLPKPLTTDAGVHTSEITNDDAVSSWRECCAVLEDSIDSLVSDAIKRGVSLVLEGVHIVPSEKIIKRWTDGGGVAVGCVLTIPDPVVHKGIILKRGEITKKGAVDQVTAFSRIRSIQEEMIRLGREHQWLMIEQRLEADPIDLVTSYLSNSTGEPVS